MKINTGKEEDPGVDMAAMMDCIFLLLIFFLVAATIRKKHNELPMNLPESLNTEIVEDPDRTLVVKVVPSKSGDCLYSVAELEQLRAFAAAAAANPEATGGPPSGDLKHLVKELDRASGNGTERNVIVKGAANVSYGDIAETINRLQEAGFTRIDIDSLPHY